MLHKRLKKRLAACLSAVLAVTCMLSSIPAVSAQQSRADSRPNLVAGLTYTTNFTEFNGAWDDPSYSKLTDGQKGACNWDLAYVGFNDKDDPRGERWINFDLGEVKEVNEVKVTGWEAEAGNIVWRPASYRIEYMDPEGVWQPFHEQTGLGDFVENANYEFGYALPDNATVEATQVRINMVAQNVCTYLSEVEIFGAGSNTPSEPEIDFVNVALNKPYTITTPHKDWDADHPTTGKEYTDGVYGNGDYNDLSYAHINIQNSEVDTIIEFDLGAPYDINGVQLSGFYYTDAYIYTPKNFRLEYFDGAEWKLLVASPEEISFPSGISTFGGDTYKAALPDNGTVKAQKVRLVTRPWSTGLYFDEIEILGIANGEEPTPPDDKPSMELPADDVAVISSGMNYTAAPALQFAAGYEDTTPSKLTNGTLGSSKEDTSSIVGIQLTAGQPQELIFEFSADKQFRGLSFHGWSDGALPSYKVDYQLPDSNWSAYAEDSITADGDDYTVDALIVGNNAANTKKVRLTLTADEDTTVYLDEIAVYEKKADPLPPTLDPNNIIGGVKYTTNLKDGNANASPAEGDYHPQHTDEGRDRLTDGVKAGKGSSWSAAATVGLHVPSPDVEHDDPDEKRIILEFNIGEAKSFQQISFSSFLDAYNGILYPRHLLIEYKNGEGEWINLFDRDVSVAGASMTEFIYRVPDNGSITCTDIRFSFTAGKDDGCWLFIDEIEVLEKATSNMPNLNPEAGNCKNILQGIPYSTTLINGNANADPKEGDYHPSHLDPDKKFLTDGLRGSDWTSNGILMFAARDAAHSIPGEFIFDLGEVKTFEQANIGIITSGDPTIYTPSKITVKVSNDPGEEKEWKMVGNYKWKEATNQSKEVVLVAPDGEPIEAQYVMFEFYHNEAWICVDEIQIYDHATGQDADAALTLKQPPLEMLRDTPPTISEDGTHIVLPESPSEFYDIELFGSDNKTVVDLDGNIHTPLFDTTVNLMYKAVLKEDPTNVEKGDYNVQITIPGKYTAESSGNEKPDTLPALREWKGGQGEFTLTDASAIVIDSSADARTEEIANSIKEFFKDMLGRDIAVKKGEAAAGDVYLKLDSSIPEMGEEGYYMNVTDKVVITAPGYTGLLYGGITATQILYDDEDHLNIPQGIARDYPMYEVRSGMVDVARAFIPMDYLKEITRYFSWFKLNELHLHVNDRGENNYQAFRIESDLEGLTATDGSYSKEEYREYQKEALKYGIHIVTEFETPGHANSFGNIPGISMLDPSHINIGDEASVNIVKSLFDEMLGGDDPVIIKENQVVHIGTDEYAYNDNNSQAIRDYTYEIAEYVKSLGYTPRFWGGLWGNSGLPNGVTTTTGIQTNFWAHDDPKYNVNYQTLYDANYDVVNTLNELLYMVPGGSAFVDYLDLTKLYNQWNVNWLSLNGTIRMPLGHPQTLGAEFAVWNDKHTSGGGLSYFDVFQRVKYGVVLLAEKNWQGEPTEGQNARGFLDRVDKFWNAVPGANPNRYVESETGTLVDYDFESVSGNTVSDNSGNAYDATVTNGTIVDGKDGKAVSFGGDGYLSLPMDGIGFPFTVEFDIKLNSAPSADATLFSGRDGTFYLNMDGSGKMGFKRDGYVMGTVNGKSQAVFKPDGYAYSFGYELPVGEWVHVKISTGKQFTTLTVNGQEYKAEMQNSIVGNISMKPTEFSSTTILPTEKIGDKMDGVLDNLNVVDPNRSEEAQRNPNLALNCTATMSSREVNETFGPDMAVDGNTALESRASFSKEEDYQWLLIDLGKVQDINRVVLYCGEQAKEYKISISETGNDDDWHEIFYKLVDGDAGEKYLPPYVIDFDTTKARYVKYEQLQRFWSPLYNTYYSGGVSEIEVYNMKGAYDITVASTENGTVTASKQTADKDEVITLTVTPNSGYKVKSVKVNGTVITPVDGVYSFTMPDKNVTVTAEFEADTAVVTYNVTVTNGTANPDKATAGTTVTLTANAPEAGKQFKEWQVSPSVTFADGTTANDATAKFTMPADDVTATAVYEDIPAVTYKVTVAATENGTVTADKQVAAEGDKVTLTINPADDYSVDSVKVNGTEITATSGVYSFTMPAEDVTVTVTFKKNTGESSYSITVANVTGGVIIPQKTSAKAGETIRVKVAPDDNYYLEALYFNNEEMVAHFGVYSFIMPAEDVVLSAFFKPYGGGSSGGGSWGGGGSTTRPSEPEEPTPTDPTWEQVDGVWKLKGTDGEYLTGWQKVDGKWYYLNSSGTMVTGWFQDGSTWYYLKSDGSMATGWLKLGNTWYYLNAGGAMKTGWLFDNGVWYYLYNWGGMANTSWVKVNNTWYYFRGNGAMMTGWLLQGNTWYYLKGNGAMATGWNWVGSKCYYFNASGKMAQNTTIGGYRVNANGEWVK